MGIIGNCKTCAIIDDRANIIWCCMPKFDSPSVFAHLLDETVGGEFSIRGEGESFTTTQTYLPGTAVLKTVFDDGTQAFEVIDFMPRYRDGESYAQPIEIHRLLRPLRGTPVVCINFQPRLNYAKNPTKISIREQASVITAANGFESVFLYSSLPIKEVGEGVPISLKEEHFFVLSYHEKFAPPTPDSVRDMFFKTTQYWEAWSAKCHLPTLYADQVLRSAITLKLLTYEKSGALLAAATTSLPEIVGKDRNWDYRYCWLRDSSMIVEALKSLGHFEEAKAFINFLLNILESKQTKTQILYGIGGRMQLEETELAHLSGYQGSKPVRVGNNAWKQKQNDIFGEIIQAIYLYYFHYKIEPITPEVWSLIKFLANTISKEWDTPDAGIWEFRHEEQHFTFSKILSWVALDRAATVANLIGKTYAAERWSDAAQQVVEDIEAKGWSDAAGAYTQVYGSKSLDASLLLMHRYGYLKADNPRWIQTVKACQKGLMNHGWAMRYTNPDDFGKPKNAFIVACFWMAQALISIGGVDEGKALFENILANANHLGLLSEDIDVKTGELTGNFPQAYSHIEVIRTAILLSDALKKK
ncbi:MAG: glycoside hydrolase family 15 protein [Deltaproteobacteria bacterium]|nr:glycoside hydrolase family 15 protein [Deltaproteobacteria bacterium]